MRKEEPKTASVRYKHLVVGDKASTLDLIVYELVHTLFSWIPGVLGLILRTIVYPTFYRGISRGAAFGANVSIRCPANLDIARGVIIEDGVQLTAGSTESPSITLKQGASCRSYAVLNAGPPDGYITIGENSRIGQGVVLYGHGGLEIGDNVMIAGQAFIVASSHVTDDDDIPYMDQGFTAKGIKIGNNVWVGAGVKILDGVTIADNAIIGSNAVVTKDVAENQTVVGIPARPIDKD